MTHVEIDKFVSKAKQAANGMTTIALLLEITELRTRLANVAGTLQGYLHGFVVDYNAVLPVATLIRNILDRLIPAEIVMWGQAFTADERSSLAELIKLGEEKLAKEQSNG